MDALKTRALRELARERERRPEFVVAFVRDVIITPRGIRPEREIT